MDKPGEHGQRVARRVLTAAAVAIALPAIMVVAQPVGLEQSLALSTRPFAQHIADLSSLGQERRLHLLKVRHGAHHPAGADAPAPPAGTRRRLITTTGPDTGDRLFSSPLTDDNLFAMTPPHLTNAAGLGSLYRLRADRQFALPLQGIPLIDHIPLVFLPASPVPEPATWSTLMVGLMMIGALLRRHRSGIAAGGN